MKHCNDCFHFKAETDIDPFARCLISGQFNPVDKNELLACSSMRIRQELCGDKAKFFTPQVEFSSPRVETNVQNQSLYEWLFGWIRKL